MAQAPVSLEVSRIQGAMTELFEALEADATKNPPAYVEPEGAVHGIMRAQQEDDIDKIIRRPVDMACRIALRLLGERLHAILGNVDQMFDIAQAAAKGPNELERMVIIGNVWRSIRETASIPIEDLNAENDE